MSKTTEKKLAQLQKQCDDFNARIPIGSAVKLTKDLGHVVETKTRSEAQVLSGHSAVVWLESERGCWEIERVAPL